VSGLELCLELLLSGFVLFVCFARIARG